MIGASNLTRNTDFIWTGGMYRVRIFKVFSSLTHEVYISEAEWEFLRETNAWYEIRSEIKTKRLKKEELNKIFSDTKEPYISFSAFCTPDMIDEIKTKMLVLMEESLQKQEKQVFQKREALMQFKVSLS